jgi:hypothetical protein
MENGKKHADKVAVKWGRRFKTFLSNLMGMLRTNA